MRRDCSKSETRWVALRDLPPGLLSPGWGVGLAVPINSTTRQIIAALVSAGRVRRAWLGIAGMQVPLPPKLQGRIGSKTGLQVAGVSPGSPAAEAGVAARGHHGRTRRQADRDDDCVQRLMVEDAIDRQIEITVWRNGALVDVFARPRELAA